MQQSISDEPRPAEPRRWDLPRYLTAFVGREQELVELTNLLRGSRVDRAVERQEHRARLITLTGTGGVGKTRLAVAAAEQVVELFADGVIFVDLTQASDAGGVPDAIARALGVLDDGALQLSARLANVLCPREMLLILDNFEHVLAAAPLVLTLLHAAPNLTVLATSRAALRVRGEREIGVQPLACPAPGGAEALDALLTYPAVALFVQCAGGVQRDLVSRSGGAASVAELCRQLDGLPLALELAAARTRLLSPEAMLGWLGQRLTLLTGGPRDMPRRQQTLRATIAWSYDLLSQEEQALFRRLAVFAGDFSLDAASSFVPAPAPVATLDLLASLTEQNLLVRVEGVVTEARFRMLQTVREFALEQLDRHGETEDAQAAHAALVVRLVEDAAPHLRRARRDQWLHQLEAEMHNIRAVVAWSSGGGDSGASLVRILRALGFLYWRIRGGAVEGVRWAELALKVAADAGPDVRADLLCVQGGLAAYLSKSSEARAILEEAVRLARGSPSATLGLALAFLGFAEGALRERSGLRSLDEGIAVTRQTGTRDDLLLALNVAAVPYARLGAMRAAHDALDECMTLANELSDDWGLAIALSSAAFVAIVAQQWNAAERHLWPALDLHRRLGDEGSVAIVLNNLAVVAQHRDDDARALELLEESLAMQRRMGTSDGTTLCHLAELALRRGDAALAQDYMEQALRDGAGPNIPPELRSAFDKLSASIRVAPCGLSSRELDVLRLLARGKSNRDIADALTISTNTVARHVSNIFDKVGAANRTEAAAFAQHLQLLTEPSGVD